MSNRLFNIIAVIFIIAVSFLIYDLVKNKPQVGNEQVLKSVLDFDPNSISSIQIKTAAENIIITKIDNEWMITKPQKSKASASYINILLNKLSTLKAHGVIDVPVRQKALEEVGMLKPPIIFGLTSDSNKYSIKFGGMTPLENGIYCNVNNSDKLYIVPRNLMSYAYISFDGLRDRTLVNILPQDISFLEIGNLVTNICFEKNEEQWMMIKPHNDLTDIVTIRKICNIPQQLEVIDFIDENKANLEKYELKQPSTFLFYKTNTTQFKLLIGKTIEEKTFVRVENRKGIFTIESKLINEAFLKLIDYRKKEIFDFSPPYISSVKLMKNGKLYLSINKTEDNLFEISPGKFNISRLSVLNFLMELKKLNVIKIPAEDLQNKHIFGLESPTYQLVLTENDKTYEYAFGVSSIPQDSHYTYVIAPNRKKILAAKYELIQILQNEELNFAPRNIIHFIPTDVKYFEIIFEKGRLKIVRNEDRTWSVVFKDKAYPADDYKIYNFLVPLSKLNAISLIKKQNESQLEVLGLAPPKFEFVLHSITMDKEIDYHMLIGGFKNTDECYVYFKDENFIFTIPMTVYSQFYTDFRKEPKSKVINKKEVLKNEQK